MSESVKSFLKFVSLDELDYWDVKRYVITDIHSKFTLIKLSNLIQERSEKVKLFEEPEKLFGILGVNNKIGLFDAYEQYGNEINQVYKKVYDGDLAYNPYRINVGSIGLKTKELKNNFISPAYVVFSSNEELNPNYLYKIFKTDTFNKIINDNTTGSVRQNLKFDTLSNIKIPLPSIDEQNKLLEKYNDKIALAQEQEKEAKDIEQSIEEYLFEELGIEKIEEKKKSSKLQFVESKNLDRWDIWTFNHKYISNKYTINFLKNIVIEKPLYGANEKGIKKITNTRYIRITDINEDGHLNDEIISPENVDEKFLLKENDFLIARSGNTVGKTFLYKNIYGRAIYAGYLVKYVLNLQKIIPEYLLYFTKSLYYKNWIQGNQRVSGQPNINGQEFLYSPIILPPMNIQDKIATEIKKRKEKIKQLKQQALKNREDAIKEFEEEIFTK